MKDNIWMSIGIFLLIPSVILGVYEGVQYHRYQVAMAYHKKVEKTLEKQNQVMNIHEVGPEKYLQEQLSCKNRTQVVKMFDDNTKWNNKYDYVISNCSKFSNNKQYQNYLNPIVNDILNGPTVQAAKTGIHFSDKTVGWNSDTATNGVMFILLNPKNEDEVHKVQDLMKKSSNYKILVFDGSSKNGPGLFNSCALNYLMASKGMRKGFNKENSWTGIAYAFNNNEFVWHSKDLSDIPNELPVKALNE